jgi:hypothetical protein
MLISTGLYRAGPQQRGLRWMTKDILTKQVFGLQAAGLLREEIIYGNITSK